MPSLLNGLLQADVWRKCSCCRQWKDVTGLSGGTCELLFTLVVSTDSGPVLKSSSSFFSSSSTVGFVAVAMLAWTLHASLAVLRHLYDSSWEPASKYLTPLLNAEGSFPSQSLPGAPCGSVWTLCAKAKPEQTCLMF